MELQPYPPWRQDPDSHIGVQVDVQHAKVQGVAGTTPAGRTRIVIEGLDERVAPYFHAVTELVQKERGQHLPPRQPGT